jgi:hypothetical protein
LAILPLVCASFTAWADPAFAASKDGEAQQLADEAIFTDYLKLDFKSAEKKLLRAIKLCGKDSCSPTVTAQVHRDLAVIYITGLKRQADGKKLLIKALTYDPRIALDADLTTPELVRAFSEAKEEVTKQDREAAPPEEPAAEEEPPAAAPQKRATEPEAEEKAAPAEPEPEPKPVHRGSVDCPPDFPGCESVDEAAEEESTKSDDKHIRNWLSLNLQQDFLMFGGESGVCKTGAPEELSCFRANDDFRARSTPTAGDGGKVSGGFGLATTRILLGYERLFANNITVGARVGYAIGGGPKEPTGAAFLPFHAELRGGYWFGSDPFSKRAIRPFADVAFGMAQVDSSVTTEVIDQNPNPSPGTQPYAVSRVSVWRKTGTLFGSIGGGAMYPLFDNGGIVAELRAMLLLPSAGTSVALQAGYSYGF